MTMPNHTLDTDHTVAGGGVVTSGGGSEAARTREVLAALRELAEGIDRHRHAVAASLGFGIAEITALAQLLHDEPVRAGDIAVRTGLTPGSVTALLDRLERRGYTVRVRPPDNRRIVLIELTPHGRTVGAAVLRPLAPAITAMLADPEAPDAADIARCLHLIATVYTQLTTTVTTEPPLHDQASP